MSEWETFYVIIGSAAAALTGLMFVAVVLIGELHFQVNNPQRQIDAFATPTVVHFGAVLLQSAILGAPWPTLTGAGIAMGVTGMAGLAYTLIVMARARRQTGYKPVFEDWLFHTVLPLTAYTSLTMAAAGLVRYQTASLFVIGGAGLLLLFIGIHNAWDTVTYVVVSSWERSQDENRES